MNLIKYLFLFSIFGFSMSFGQNTFNYSFASLEYNYGKTAPANFDFPETNPQQGFVFSVGKTNYSNQLAWARQLNYPKTGLVISYTDFGNANELGSAITIMPYLNFGILKKWTNRLDLKIGMGASFFDKIYDENTNKNNQAISTPITWAFRSFLYYSILDTKQYNFQIGAGYYHNSNGHVRLPNYGLNSFLIGVSSQIKFPKKPNFYLNLEETKTDSYKTYQTFYSYRFGIGQNVLTEYNDTKKEVFVFSASIGKIKNKTFKYSAGFYYRFYENYYDHINDEGLLVNELYPKLKRNPILKASNFGLNVNGELMMSHVGIELEIGFNIYKPFYKLDWNLNEGKYVDQVYQLGELSSYYDIKHIIASRLGLKLYAVNTNKSPKHNLFLGAYINANLGQADFSELSLGYVYCLPLKKK